MVDGRKIIPSSRVSSEGRVGGDVSTKETPRLAIRARGGVEGWDVATRRSRFCCSQQIKSKIKYSQAHLVRLLPGVENEHKHSFSEGSGVD
jgi:hypothetical protein